MDQADTGKTPFEYNEALGGRNGEKLLCVRKKKAWQDNGGSNCSNRKTYVFRIVQLRCMNAAGLLALYLNIRDAEGFRSIPTLGSALRKSVRFS